MQAVKLNFPLAKSAGNLYQAQKQFPHSKTWVGQALGQVDLPAREDSLLGLAFSYDFSEKDAPKVTETLSHFTSVDFSMGTFSGKVLAAMLASPLVELRLDFAALSKEDLENLAKQESIETLWFTGASLRDEQLVHLGPLPKLTSLALKSTALSSRALELMSGAGFQSLRRLHLPANIDDQGAEFLARGGSLITELDLSFSKISDAAGKALASLKLETLYLNDTAFGDAGLEQLKESPTLKVLFLNGSKISDKGLTQLAEMPALEHLELRDTKITEMGAARLRGKLKDCAVFGP
ncbi:MAG TPA: hypothetical protein PLC15_17595 [Candidatus Obscuribacter sp.]|nr:hypothetical protein [Candidatus Obscuribacter sp.]